MEFVVVFTLQNTSGIESASIVNAPFKKDNIFLALNFNIKGPQIITDTDKVEDRFLAVGSLDYLFPVQIPFVGNSTPGRSRMWSFA